jgi:ABC-type transport system involved in multi-copper enzyme maturation permease subunit
MSPTMTTDRSEPTQETPMTTNLDATITGTTITGTTTDTGDDAVRTDATAPPSGGRVSTWNVARGEWTKFWSVRSTKFTLLAAGVVTVVFGMIFSAVAESGEAAGPATLLTDPLDLALAGMALGEMIVGVLGVLIVAGEYSTGLIRTTFAAVGRRTKVLWAKSAVLATSVFAMAAVAVTAAVVLGQAVYAGDLPTVPVADALDVILGAVVYLTGIGLIGLALGFLLRSTAAGIAVLVGGVFIGPNLLNLLPESITDVFMKYLPSEAGSAMMTQVTDPELLSRGAGYVVFIAWVIGLLGLAGYLVRKRDA